LEKLLVRIAEFAGRWNLIQRFNIVGLGITILGTVMIGWWVGEEIKASIINESAAATALYLDSFVTPNLQELAHSDSLTPEHAAALNNLLEKTDIGQQIVAIKVWDENGKILYSNTPSLVGQVFLSEMEEMAPAWKGLVVAGISDLKAAENFEERQHYDHLLEIHIPIRLNGAHQVITVAEFYQRPDTIESQIRLAQRQSWLVVGSGMGVIYLLLALFFRWTRSQIAQREVALRNQVAQLTELITQNDELDLRIRRATANAVTLNERLLRRISAELDSNATQKIHSALIELRRIVETSRTCPLAVDNTPCNENLPIIETSLETAIQEIHALVSGLGLPQLDMMSLEEVFTSVVRAHEKRTATRVTFEMGTLPESVPLPVRIAAYRIVQEALNNAYRHAGGVGQEVRVAFEAGRLRIEVSDRGPGFDSTLPLRKKERLGLAGMRERVESLGGMFRIERRQPSGTTIQALLPLSFWAEGEVVYE